MGVNDSQFLEFGPLDERLGKCPTNEGDIAGVASSGTQPGQDCEYVSTTENKDRHSAYFGAGAIVFAFGCLAMIESLILS